VKRSYLFAVVLMLLVCLVGCAKQTHIDNDSGKTSKNSETGGEISVGLPEPLTIKIDEGTVDVKNTIIRRIGNKNDMSYEFNNISSLSEFYFVTVEVDGVELTLVQISRGYVSYIFYSIEAIEAGQVWRDIYTEVSININRLDNTLSPDEAWQIVAEQALDDGGVLSERYNMVYSERHNDIIARIGDTWFSIRVPDRLNNQSFLENLALEVIETSELVILD